MSHRRRHRCASCLEALDIADALVTSDDVGPLVFCDAACAEDFEEFVAPPRFDRGDEHERELPEDFDPIASDTDD